MSFHYFLSNTTGSVGTQKFMAPEIINEEKYDEKVDVYSFGVLVYFILNEGDLSEIKIHRIFKTIEPKDRPSFEEIIEDLSHNNFNLIDLDTQHLTCLKLCLVKCMN